MEETTKLSRLTVDMGGRMYELDGGGGGSQPGPNTVGTEELKDGAVEMQDLHDDVRGTMLTGDDRVSQGDLDRFEV